MYKTIQELADEYKFHKATVARWIKEGKLKSYTTPGGRHRILERDFKVLLGIEEGC